jgi:hypothetical protein
MAHRDTQAPVTMEELLVTTLATSERKLVSVRLDQR